MKKYWKLTALVVLITISFIAKDAAAISVDPLGLNADYIANPEGAPLIVLNCSEYTGFINKFVQCITHITTQEEIFSQLTTLNNKFSGAANAALIFYMVLFGMKLSMNAVDNAKNEIFIVILTVFLIAYVNTSVRMENFIKLFVGLQNEFANVAFAAVYTQNNNDAAAENYNEDKYVCFGPRNKDGSIATDVNGQVIIYSIWQRMDCIFAYIMGAIPLAEMKSHYADLYGEGRADNLNISDVDTDYNQKLRFGFGRYGDMATDPYCFFEYVFSLNADNGGNVTTTAADIYGAAQNVDNGCYKKLEDTFGANDITGLIELPRPIKNDGIEVFMSFSLIVIAIGMLFSDPGLGLIIFMSGLAIIAILLAAFAQAAFVYITSLFAILVLGLLAPIIIPMFLFKQTRDIFTKWVQLMFAYSLQPGIMICYLIFMLSVLQYVISYNMATGPFMTQDTDVSDDNPHDLIDYQFGELYTKGFKGFREAFRIFTNTSSDMTQYYAKNAYYSSLTKRDAAKNNTDIHYTLTGHGTVPQETLAYEATTEGYDAKSSISPSYLLNTGSSINTFNVPAFDFYMEDEDGNPWNLRTKEIAGFANYDAANKNIEQSAANAMANLDDTNPTTPLPLDAAKANMEFYQKEQYKLKIGYMQILMTIFITMAILFAFMNNVMEFAGKLVGIGAPSIGRPGAIYEAMTKKLNKMLKT